MLVRVVLHRRPLFRRSTHYRLPPISTRALRITRTCYSTDNDSSQTSKTQTRRENIYTLPNLLTSSRIIACPVLGWSIIQGNFPLATGLLLYAGVSDLVSLLRPFHSALTVIKQLDGYIARKYKSRTVVGSILDPAADKALMTTLVISLAYKGMLPRQ